MHSCHCGHQLYTCFFFVLDYVRRRLRHLLLSEYALSRPLLLYTMSHKSPRAKTASSDTTDRRESGQNGVSAAPAGGGPATEKKCDARPDEEHVTADGAVRKPLPRALLHPPTTGSEGRPLGECKHDDGKVDLLHGACISIRASGDEADIFDRLLEAYIDYGTLSQLPSAASHLAQ